MTTPQERALLDVICAVAKTSPLAGRYAAVEVLDTPRSGAFSFVLRAYDNASRRPVVLKVLHPSADPYRGACFQREAKVTGDLVGKDNIIQLVGGLETVSIPLVYSPSGQTVPFAIQFFAVEVARGTLTAYLLGAKKQRAVYRRLEVIRDVVKGVARLHRIGFCHRDLKPDNIFMCSRGVAKVADLGTCRLHSGADPIALNYHMPVGDLLYAAPEMFFGAGQDPRNFVGADWFSVGAILFEAVTGQLLYVAIGLRNPNEIASALGLGSDLREYERKISTTAGKYPVPGTNEFSAPWLAPLSPLTHAAITDLVRDLCDFNFRRRLADFSSILRRLDASIIRARRDQAAFERRAS